MIEDYSPILSIVHNQIYETTNPNILIYKDDYNIDAVGLADISGTTIVSEVIAQDSLYIVDYNNRIIISFYDSVSCEDKIYMGTLEKQRLKYECIHRSKNLSIDKVLSQAIILYDNHGAKSVIDFKGRRLTENSYLNILDSVNTKELIGVNYLTIGSNSKSIIRSIDILTLNGELKEENITDNKHVLDRFGVTLSKLYTRNASSLYIKEKRDKRGRKYREVYMNNWRVT